MTLSNLYLAAADKLRHKGLLPDSRPATLTMCASELGRSAPTGERALLEKFLTQVEKRIDKSNRALRELKARISGNSDITKKYLEDVI